VSLKEHIEKNVSSYFVGSRAKLAASMRHKIRRTFIAALECLEDELGADSEQFRRLRKDILREGNDQIRNMEAELEKYNIEFIPYHVEFRTRSVDVKDEGAGK